MGLYLLTFGLDALRGRLGLSRFELGYSTFFG